MCCNDPVVAAGYSALELADRKAQLDDSQLDELGPLSVKSWEVVSLLPTPTTLLLYFNGAGMRPLAPGRNSMQIAKKMCPSRVYLPDLSQKSCL
jgi:hypothetical protein